MSVFKLLLSAAGVLALVSSSASAGSLRYAGGPKTGQAFVQRDTPTLGSPFDARAELVLPQRSTPRGGISSRGL